MGVLMLVPCPISGKQVPEVWQGWKENFRAAAAARLGEDQALPILEHQSVLAISL